ncbi:MAG: helix-turn-helix domain-containing protein [Hyphomicrobiaceae bacterium]|nr:helix-turn-helix domain-containing protein [Hyphomicrobiaceae bacterium]
MNTARQTESVQKRFSEQQAAEGFAALGNRARLRLLRLLVRAGREGLNVSDIGKLMEMPASTLAHHLSSLVRAGLVIQERRGREVICTADFSAIEAAASFLTEECCEGVPRPARADETKAG